MFTGPSFQIKLYLLTTVLLSGYQSSRGSFEIHWLRHYLLQDRANFPNFKHCLSVFIKIIDHKAWVQSKAIRTISYFSFFVHSLYPKHRLLECVIPHIINMNDVVWIYIYMSIKLLGCCEFIIFWYTFVTPFTRRDISSVLANRCNDIH